MNVFRGEATKKFDAILGIDMRQLLQNVGAKPDQIERILATARVNAEQGFGASRARPVAEVLAGAAAEGGANGGGGPRAGAGGGPGGGPGAGGGQRRQMSPEMQQRVKELAGGKDVSELSPEERRNLFQQMRSQFGGRQGGGAGGGAFGGGGAGLPGGLGLATAPASDFTAEQRKAATVPQPPEEGSDVEILLRPGLLADAEIIVDSMKDVLYVPFQAVFETPQGPIVYFWNGKALEPRKIEVGRRSESQVVVTAGLEEGDQISLEPPSDERRERDKTSKKKSGAAPPTVPGAGPGVGGGRAGGSRGGMI
jgi:hypothetical protein